jgi:hypothetical protein
MPDSLENYRVILDMMHIGMIEIRSSEKIDTCKAIADIFHNVPNSIARKTAPSEIYEAMFRVAKRNGFEKYVDNLQKHCTQKVMKTEKGSTAR